MRTPNKRTSLRLPQFDYSQCGAYFITLISHQRQCFFGEIVHGQVALSELGGIVEEEWFVSDELRTEIKLYEDEFVIMPNHIHGIVWIVDSQDVNTIVSNGSHTTVGATGRSPLRKGPSRPSGPAPKSLGLFIAGYKSSTTKRINLIRKTPGKRLWMRNYHDRIIRDEDELREIRRYIDENPVKWELDHENPEVRNPSK